MDLFEKLAEVVGAAAEDAKKFYESGNAAAGTRLRKAMQEAKGLAQEVRLDVQAKKNG